MNLKIQKIIGDTLSNSVELTNLIGSGKINYNLSPSNEIFPYIVYYEVSAQSPNKAKLDDTELYFDVRIVGPNATVLSQAGEIVKDLLHDKLDIFSSLTDVYVYRCKHFTQTRFLEQNERVQITKLTHTFKINTNK